MQGPLLFHAGSEEWGDWQWQIAHCVKSLSTLQSLSQGAFSPDDEMLRTERTYPMLTTPFYLSLAQNWSPDDPVLAQVLPMRRELDPYPECSDDGLAEEAFSPVPRLVHRYRDRTLFLTTSCCAVRCRHCMRKRLWGHPVPVADDSTLGRCADYLNAHPEVREILISGGDPLLLTDKEISRVLHAFASVPSVKMLRIGTRTLVALPQRITTALCEILEATGKSVWIATHFNHPQELTDEAAQAVRRLLAHGVPVVNQSVLLKDINDSADTLAELFTRLLDIRIKPYYLFHGDPIQGAGCFRTGLGKGLSIMAELRGKVSGMALPAFAFDLPEGGGKIRLEPDFQRGATSDGAPVFEKLDGACVPYR